MDNTQVLYPRLDIEGVVTAHLLASDKAHEIGFARYIVSATSPFDQTHLVALRKDAAGAVRQLYPDCERLISARGWRLFERIDRVYVNARARRELGWSPGFDFAHVLESLRAQRDFRSALARQVGSKGYHDTVFLRRWPLPRSLMISDLLRLGQSPHPALQRACATRWAKAHQSFHFNFE